MASINAVILRTKASKDGRHKIRISVAHNGQTRYIPTSIILDSASEFKNGKVVKRADASFLNTKVRGLLQHYQDLIDELGFVDGFSCPELIYMMKTSEMQRHRTLNSVIDEYKENARIKQSTLGVYSNSLNIILRYIDGNCLLDHITPSTILSLDAKLRKQKLNPTTIRNYMLTLKLVINYAVKLGYVMYRVNPFANYKFPLALIRQSWITVDQLKEIRDFKTSDFRLSRCRDIFMLSYYLGGINLTDLVHLKFERKDRSIKYIRRKIETRLANIIPVEFRIPDEAWEIICKYKDKNNMISIFPSQTKGFNVHQNETGYRTDDYFMKKHMKILSQKLNIPNLVFYSARKSFSQHAFELGIRDAIIDYLLGHTKGESNKGSLINYRRVTPKQATESIRLVLDNLK